MKIYVVHATSFDYLDELYKPLKASKLYREHEVILPHESTEKDSKLLIEASDLIIAEVSYPSTGSGIELGWADDLAIPILCIFKSGTKPSSALQYITNQFFSYENTQELIAQLEAGLSCLHPARD